MTEMEFSIFWSKSHAFFGIDAGTKAKLSSYNATLEEVKDIPAEALEVALERIKDLDSMPRNLIKQIRSAWFEWKSKNPDRLIGELNESKNCPFCEGGNIFVVSRKEGSVPRTTFYPCGHCRSGGYTRAVLEDMGWEITNPKLVRQGISVQPYQQQKVRSMGSEMRSPEQSVPRSQAV